MLAMLVMLVACLAAWAHVLGMLERSSARLAGALSGDLSQAGGWMPASGSLGRDAAPMRARTRA